MAEHRPSDQELIKWVLSGDKLAFNALFDRYLAMVRGEAKQRGLRMAEGDVVQETFLRAYLRLHELADPSRFSGWLRRIAQRVCFDEMRKQHQQTCLLAQLEPAESGSDPTSQELQDVLSLLTPGDREAIHLHYILGLDTAAAAKAVGVQPQAFRVRLHRARERARSIAKAQRLKERMTMSGLRGSELAKHLIAEAEVAARAGHPGPVLIQDWPAYRRKLEEAVAADPESTEAAWKLGRKLAREGEYRPAMKLLQGLWDRGTHDAWTSLTIAWCYDYLGHRAEALQWYARTALMPFLSETQRKAAVEGIEAPQKPKVPPTIPAGIVEVDKTGWSVAASHDGCPPMHAIDDDLRTRWSPMGEGQTPGMWLRVDMGTETPSLTGTWLDDDATGLAHVQNDAPRHCLVSVSQDGEWWKRVGEWHWTPNRYMEAWWAPVSARHVLFEQLDYCSPEWWSVYEVHLFHADQCQSS